MAAPDPAAVERQMYVDMKLGGIDDPSLTLAELRDMTGGGANSHKAEKVGNLAKVLADAINQEGSPARLLLTESRDLAQASASSAASSAAAAQDAANLVGAPADSAVAAAVNGTSQTRTALDGRYSRSDLAPINVAQKYGRDDAAVRAAFADAVSTNRPLYFTHGDFNVTGDLTVTTRVELAGDGYSSRLLFTNGGLILDATAGFLLHPKFRDLRIRRIGTVAGPALHLKGISGGTVGGVARINAYNLHLSSPAGNTGPGSSGGFATAGDALLVESSYTGFFHGCYFEESGYGIRGLVAGVSGPNNLTFLGGEANGNHNAWTFQQPIGVSFYGFATQGNYAAGGRVYGLARGFTYAGGYFELNNGGPDIEVDCSAGSGGINISHNAFSLAGTGKAEAILLKRGRVAVNNNHFSGITAGGAVAIRISEGTSPVSGEARGNMREDDGTVIAYTTGGAAFNVTQLGQITKASTTSLSSTLNEQAGVAWVRKVSQALDFPSIPANSEAVMTVTVTGATTTDDVSVSTSMLESGLSLSAWGVTAADTVSIRLRNNTAAAIDPSARTYRVRVWR